MARYLLTNATNGTIGAATYYGKSGTIHAWGTTSTGTGSATITIEVSNDTTAPWLTAGTISLTLGTTATADGFALDADWDHVRARVTSSGTDAAVTVALGGAQ